MDNRHPLMFLLNANPGRRGTVMPRPHYEAVRRALLAAVPPDEQGMPLRELPAAVAARLPPGLVEAASIARHTTSVRLDLEARELIERVPGARPQRVRRVRSGPFAGTLP
jgi:hypothetical protein